MIVVEHFSWRFADAAAPALREVSLRIELGEFVVVTGPSGSGKTTLALAVCGLLIGRQAGEMSGRIHVRDHDVATTPLCEHARDVGLVQQNPEAQFAALTVPDEIAFGLENRCVPRDEILRACADALRLLNIEHLRDRRLDTLSGGEQQRVAIAAMIAAKPAVLVLDEPTSGLDPEASLELFQVLARLGRDTGLTVVVIEHKLAQLLPLQPRVVHLHNGCVVEDGPASARVGGVGLRPASPTTNEGTGPAAQEELIAARECLAELADVTVTLAGRVVLDQVSIRVPAGEVIGVLGPNGGGKTTLLHCLMGLVRPTGGTVRMNGASVTAAKISWSARQAGLVFQNADHQLVAESVWEEALFAVRAMKIAGASHEEAARKLLQTAGLADRMRDHPHRLSWGEKRRLNLISAILHGPRLLLLDEPFAGQDWDNVEFLLTVMRAVMCGELPETFADGSYNCGTAAPGGGGSVAQANSLCRGTVALGGEFRRTSVVSSDAPGVPGARGACLVVTHDPRIVARACDRVLFLDAGRVLVDAPVAQAFEQLAGLGRHAYLPLTATVREWGPGGRGTGGRASLGPLLPLIP